MSAEAPGGVAMDAKKLTHLTGCLQLNQELREVFASGGSLEVCRTRDGSHGSETCYVALTIGACPEEFQRVKEAVLEMLDQRIARMEREIKELVAKSSGAIDAEKT